MTNYNSSFDQTPYLSQRPLRPGDYPGKTLGIVAMILSLASLIGFPTAIVGVILGHISYNQGKQAGFKNTFALVGIIVGWILLGITVLLVLLFLLSIGILGALA